MIKPVSILFADVVGSTTQAERMHPEETRALMVGFFEAMSEEIRAEGGTIERLIGDAIMADFGVPITREDDARRAVKAARRMFARLERFNSEREETLQIRVGINTGEVSTGGSLGEQLMVMGDAVNVAARLQQMAEPGTIVIGERTARSVRDYFDLEPLPPVIARGRSERLNVFTVGEEIAEPERRPVLVAFVGRKTELDSLHVSFEGARRAERLRLVTIVGEPGVGKSRLIQEFTNQIGDDAKVIAGRCLPYEAGITLSPLRDVLRTEAGLVVSEGPDEGFEKIVALVRSTVPEALAPDPERVGAALAATRGRAPAFSALDRLDPREVRRELTQAWSALLTGFSSERPLVWVVEDVHWADEVTLEVITELARHIEGPVLFLCSARPEFLAARADWIAALPTNVTISLEPLDPDESSRLISNLIGTGEHPLGFWDRVIAKAEGNPFFIEETIRRLMDGGYLVPENGGWAVAHDVPEPEISDNVQTVILSRLDLLDPRDKVVIQLASVVGRTFWSGALERLTGSDDVEAMLRSLERHQLVTRNLESGLPGEFEFVFKHALIREVAYESIPRVPRGEAHAATAGWIEEVRGERAAEVAELLAHHYGSAFDLLTGDALREKARDYCLLAANDAVRRFMVERAARFGERAVELSSPGTERAEALETLGDVSYMALRGESAWESYSGAIEELGDARGDDFVRLAAKATIVPTRWVGTMSHQPPADEIEDLIEAGIAAAPDGDGRDRAMLLAARAFFQGAAVGEMEDAGERSARAAIEMAERLDDPDLVSAAMDALAVWLWPSGRWGEVARVGRARLELVPRLADVREICDICLSAGRDLTSIGHYEDSVKYLSQAMDRARGVDTGQYLHALVHRVYPRFMSGDWDGALEDQAEVERLETPTGGHPPRYAIRPFGVVLFLHTLRGEIEEADRYLQIIRRFRAEIAGLTPDAWGPLAVPARTLAYAGQPEEAMGWLRLDRWRGRGEHLEAACEIAPLLDDRSRSEEVLEAARAEAEHGELEALHCFADRLEGRMAATKGDLGRAAGYLERSADGFVRLGAAWEEAWSRLLLAETNVELGLGVETETQLSRALTTFERLRSVQEIERARTLSSRL